MSMNKAMGKLRDAYQENDRLESSYETAVSKYLGIPEDAPMAEVMKQQGVVVILKRQLEASDHIVHYAEQSLLESVREWARDGKQ